MTVYEFQSGTGFFADFALYQAACAEYERYTPDGQPVYASIEDFCDSYLDNDEGIAEKIRYSANEKINGYIGQISVLQSEKRNMQMKIEQLKRELYTRDDNPLAASHRNSGFSAEAILKAGVRAITDMQQDSTPEQISAAMAFFSTFLGELGVK